MIVNVEIKSLKFIDELRKRRQSMTNRVLSARVKVPDDLRFWYWLEFGTAGRQDPAAPVKSKWPDKYPIDPVNADALHWPDATHPNEPSGGRFQMHVEHPGIRPRMIIRSILDEIQTNSITGIINAGIRNGWRFSELQTQLLQGVMPEVIEMIAESFERQAPGTREDGKLDGNSAADVFREEAEIENTST